MPSQQGNQCSGAGVFTILDYYVVEGSSIGLESARETSEMRRRLSFPSGRKAAMEAWAMSGRERNDVGTDGGWTRTSSSSFWLRFNIVVST